MVAESFVSSSCQVIAAIVVPIGGFFQVSESVCRALRNAIYVIYVYAFGERMSVAGFITWSYRAVDAQPVGRFVISGLIAVKLDVIGFAVTSFFDKGYGVIFLPSFSPRAIRVTDRQ